MADMPITTRGRANELSFSHSPISQAFSRFIGTLGMAIEGERDIEGALWSDPGFADWLRSAERDWEAATTACKKVLDLPATRPSDTPLQKLAQVIWFTLGCETFAELCCAQQVLASHPDLFSQTGHDPVSRRIEAMLARGRAQLDELCKLDMLADLETLDQPEPPTEHPELEVAAA
ncbi:hypothetical protein [uncultured Celeribacter sp.]|uniref:hypothetical protein n=1 Tax=uncultured Celeribacter sp. TaxID=1303376 RepID=UPI002AA88B2A|nr:hypothetical protein [uncultured Celeribacter sp.]